LTSLLGAFTNRSPVPVATPYRVTPLMGQRGSSAALRAMENTGTVFAIVNRSAEAASAVEWKLYRKRTDGRRTYAYDGMDERTEVTNHLALNVLNKPNPFFTRQELIEVYAQHMCLTGEAWWALGYMGGLSAPTEIWPVRPDRMAVVESPTEYIEAYEYQNPDGTRTRLETDEVIFSRRPDPLSAYRGVGPIQSVLAKIDSVRYSDEWNRSYFLNSAEPGGILKINRDLDDDEFRRLQYRWNEAHKGPQNAHRVAILDMEDADWVERQAVHRDMQFAELSQLNAEQIREAFGFPKPLLGTVTDVNRANAEAAEVVFARWVLVPLLERIKAALNDEFLPLFGSTGQGVEFDYCNPVPDDRAADTNELTAKVNAVVALVGAGADAKAACEVVGLPPMQFEKVTAPSPVVMPTTDAPPAIENAQRWTVKAVIDDNTCQPCKDNNGHTYRNRAAAYADYPGGTGYVKCTGEEYGNSCRCRVIKRRDA
jgi:HK97 family phage portal protein